jgi:hypothetical protein
MPALQRTKATEQAPPAQNPADLICCWLRGDQRAGAGDALPGAVDLDPGVGEAFAVHVGLSFFGALYAKRPDHYGGIPVHLHIALLGHGLGRLITRRLNAGQEFALGGNAAVDIDGYKGAGEDHVQGLGVLGFEGVVPCVFKRKDTASFIVNAFLLRHCQSNTQQRNPDNYNGPFHGCTLRTDTRNRTADTRELMATRVVGKGAADEHGIQKLAATADFGQRRVVLRVWIHGHGAIECLARREYAVRPTRQVGGFILE